MSSAGEFAVRVRGYFTDAGRGLTRMFRRTVRDVVTTVEERPGLGPVDLELPYPLPTREDPLAFGLFYFSILTIVVTLTLTASTLVALGEVPLTVVGAIATLAVILGISGNLHIVGRYVHDNSTELLRPLVGTGMPLLNAVHYWFGPVVAILAVLFVLLHASNNYLMHSAAAVLVAWMVSGLLLKLPKDSPWNGPALKRWAGAIHKRPFVYVVVIAFVMISVVADVIY